jgi:hypothetical protein
MGSPFYICLMHLRAPTHFLLSTSVPAPDQPMFILTLLGRYFDDTFQIRPCLSSVM